MKTTTACKPNNPNIPPRLQQQPPRLQKQMLAQQQSRQQSQEKQLWEPDDAPKKSVSNSSFDSNHQSPTGTSLWDPDKFGKTEGDVNWKQPVWDPDSDHPQRKPLSQPAKLWEPKTGKFKIVEISEPQPQRASTMHAWASPQQEVKPQAVPNFPPPGGAPPIERSPAPQSQGQTTQPFNQFMMFRPDFR